MVPLKNCPKSTWTRAWASNAFVWWFKAYNPITIPMCLHRSFVRSKPAQLPITAKKRRSILPFALLPITSERFLFLLPTANCLPTTERVMSYDVFYDVPSAMAILSWNKKNLLFMHWLKPYPIKWEVPFQSLKTNKILSETSSRKRSNHS